MLSDLVIANHILAAEDISAAFGRVSIRHPDRTCQFLMAGAVAPSCVTPSDIMIFDACGEVVDSNKHGESCEERFVHAAVYSARADVNSVIYFRSLNVLSFCVSIRSPRVLANSGGVLGGPVPLWDIRDGFGADTHLMISNMTIANDLARALGSGAAFLMRGNGALVASHSVKHATFLAVTFERQAWQQMLAHRLGHTNWMTEEEIAITGQMLNPGAAGDGIGRVWGHWREKVCNHGANYLS